MLEQLDRSLSDVTDEHLSSIGVVAKKPSVLRFVSGVAVEGVVSSITRDRTSGKLLLISFDQCRVTNGSTVLFDPSWGTYDMAVGARVSSVFGGPADRLAYGETDDFAAKVIPRKTWSPIMKEKHRLYQSVRDLRNALSAGSMVSDSAASEKLEKYFSVLESDFPHDWLLRLEILEIARTLPSDQWRARLELQLENMSEADAALADRIAEGVRVFGQSF